MVDHRNPRHAAEAELLISSECSGEGSAYRIVAKLWRSNFRPPSATRGASWYETPREQRTSNTEGPPQCPARTQEGDQPQCHQ